MVLNIPQKLFISCLVDCYDIQGSLNLRLLIFLMEQTHILSLCIIHVTVIFDLYMKVTLLVQKVRVQTIITKIDCGVMGFLALKHQMGCRKLSFTTWERLAVIVGEKSSVTQNCHGLLDCTTLRVMSMTLKIRMADFINCKLKIKKFPFLKIQTQAADVWYHC